MGSRPRLSAMRPADRQATVNVILGALWDERVNQHRRLSRGTPGDYVFDMALKFVTTMDPVLQSALGWPLPIWTPDETIPPEFMVVKPNDYGGPRAPLANATPNVQVPAALGQPLVTRRLAGRFSVRDTTGTELLDVDYHFSIAVAGALWVRQQEGAAPIYWCWQAWLADYAQELQASCDGAPTVGSCKRQSVRLLPNADGRLQLVLSQYESWGPFAHTCAQLGPDRWSGWTRLHSNMEQAAATVRSDGRVAVFGLANGRAFDPVYTASTPTAIQRGPSSLQWDTEKWAGPDRGGVLASLAVAQQEEGSPQARVALFGVSNGRLFTKLEDAPGSNSYGDWGLIGGAGISPPMLAALHTPLDNTVVVLHIGSDSRVWALHQYPDGYCRDPYQIQPLGGVNRVWAVLNNDRTASCVVQVGTDLLLSRQNLPDYHWDAFTVIMGQVSTACVLANAAGRLEIFACDVNGQVLHCMEIRAGLRRFVALPVEGNGPYLDLAAARGVDGRMQVVGLRKAGDEWFLDRATEWNPGEDVRYSRFAQMY